MLRSSLTTMMSLVSMLGLGGCVSLLPEKGPTPTKYTLALKMNAVPDVAPGAKVLSSKIIKILEPLAEETYQTTRISVRVEKTGVVQTDYVADALWSEALPSLVQRRLIDFMTQRQLFKGVLHADEKANADLLALPTLESFGLVSVEGGTLRAKVHLRMKLVDEQTRRLVIVKDFVQEEDIPYPTQIKSIAALESCFNHVLQQVDGWFREKDNGF